MTLVKTLYNMLTYMSKCYLCKQNILRLRLALSQHPYKYSGKNHSSIKIRFCQCITVEGEPFPTGGGASSALVPPHPLGTLPLIQTQSNTVFRIN